jgi:hypothetical protein
VDEAVKKIHEGDPNRGVQLAAGTSARAPRMIPQLPCLNKLLGFDHSYSF